MSDTRDIISVSWTGLMARRIRTLLIMIGPIMGVAAMVCAFGLTESAKGSLQQQLAELGTNLIVAQAGGSFGSQNPTLPNNAVQRVDHVSTVEEASATSQMNGIVALPFPGASNYDSAFPIPVRASDLNLPKVLKVPIVDGRWLDSSDNSLHLPSAVLGEGVATHYGYLDGESRTIELNGKNFGVVGVLGAVPLTPSLDNAVFISQWSAKHVFHTSGNPNELYIRADPGTTKETSNALQTAISLGGTDSASMSIPSDTLQAASEANKTVQDVAVFAGILALVIGGLGIANVMFISVIQRSSEIGIRRAVGHSRTKIALQFLLESLFVGALGGLVGAGLGTLIVIFVSWVEGWVVELAYHEFPYWLGLAVLVSMIAGLFPAIKAALLEPLETLRLG